MPRRRERMPVGEVGCPPVAQVLQFPGVATPKRKPVEPIASLGLTKYDRLWAWLISDEQVESSIRIAAARLGFTKQALTRAVGCIETAKMLDRGQLYSCGPEARRWSGERKLRHVKNMGRIVLRLLRAAWEASHGST
jgi:hypothetical protein